MLVGLVLISVSASYTQEKKDVFLEGVIMDEYDTTVPYAAIGIPSKYLGTSSNDDGGFQLSLFKSNLQDSLEVSSIGYETYKITVQDYLNQKEKIIVIKEEILLDWYTWNKTFYLLDQKDF